MCIRDRNKRGEKLTQSILDSVLDAAEFECHNTHQFTSVGDFLEAVSDIMGIHNLSIEAKEYEGFEVELL